MFVYGVGKLTKAFYSGFFLIFDKAGEHVQWKRQSLQQMVLGKLDSDMQKNQPGPLSYTMNKNKLKMDERPKCKTGSHQNPDRKSVV